MRKALVLAAAVAALVASPSAHASTPQPWCGTDVVAVDRQPDATAAFAVHVLYVRAPGAPDRFAQWAPRIVGDLAAVDAWWRREDRTRAFRFDTYAFPGCTSAFGSVDLASVELRQRPGGIRTAFQELRLQLAADHGFRHPEKVYLVYYDGPTEQTGAEQVCGQGAPAGGFGLPGIAVVYVDACGAESSDRLRPVVAVHELVHVLGAVDDEAPNACQSGHVCDARNDLLWASLSGGGLETILLDVNRDDYYGHTGDWTDLRKSLFLEPLDGVDRTPPTAPGLVRVGEDASGLTRLSWRPAADDAGPVRYRLYQGTQFVRQVSGSSVLVPAFTGGIAQYGIRAVDAAGRLSPLVVVRFRAGVGMVDAAGRLVRDTVAPGPVTRVRARRDAKTVLLTWPAVRDAGGIRAYRVRSGGRTIVVRRPAIRLALTRLRGTVSIAPVDRAGNVGAAFVVPVARLR